MPLLDFTLHIPPWLGSVSLQDEVPPCGQSQRLSAGSPHSRTPFFQVSSFPGTPTPGLPVSILVRDQKTIAFPAAKKG